MLNSRIWEFTGETKIEVGITLQRIRLAFNCKWGLKGELGGWIEKEENLSGNAWVYGDAQVSGDAQVYGGARVSGNAWVYGGARVYGNAWVYGGARVSGNAQVYGDAWVYGDAQVYGDARVYGGARVYGNTQVYGNAKEQGRVKNLIGGRWSVTCWSNGKIVIGCLCHDAKDWAAFSDAQIAKMHEDALAFWKTYRPIVLALSEQAVKEGSGHAE